MGDPWGLPPRARSPWLPVPTRSRRDSSPSSPTARFAATTARPVASRPPCGTPHAWPGRSSSSSTWGTCSSSPPSAGRRSRPSITRDDAGGVGLSARLESQAFRQPKVLTVVGGADVHAALAHCVQRIQRPRASGGARSSPTTSGSSGRACRAREPRSWRACPRCPTSGCARWPCSGAIEEHLRESWVQLRFERATLLVASIGPHCVYAVVDEVRSGPFGEAVDEVRAILSPYDLSEAATLATEIGRRGDRDRGRGRRRRGSAGAHRHAIPRRPAQGPEGEEASASSAVDVDKQPTLTAPDARFGQRGSFDMPFGRAR